MTKKDYIKIANVLKDFSDINNNIDINIINNLIDKFSSMLKSDNNSFNQEKFINYIKGI